MLLWAASHQLDEIIFTSFVLNLFSSVQSSVVSVSLQRHGLQHARLPYPLPTPEAYSSSCPSAWWCHPTILSCLPLLFLPSIFPNIRVFPNELIIPTRWENNWSFNFSISFSSEYSGLIFFRMDLFYTLAVQGTLKSLFQCHSSKGIYVCHLSVTSYSPCWDLTTRTELKQHAKMSAKTQCPIYTHLVTRRGSCCIQVTVINRSNAGIGPGSPGWVFKYDCLYLAATVVLSSWIGKTFQNRFLYVWFGRQNFSWHRPYGKSISEIYPFIFRS